MTTTEVTEPGPQYLLGVIAALLAVIAVVGIVIAVQVHKANERQKEADCLAPGPQRNGVGYYMCLDG